MIKNKLNLQLFADGDNNNQDIRSFQKEFKEFLTAVFGHEAYFRDLFGELEALDGVRDNEDAFYVKTSDIPVTVGNGYDKTATKAFGTGTGSGNRFGERVEIIYKDTPVKYTWGWNFHEGIDRHTVNNDFDAAVADRLDLQAQAKIDQFNKAHGKFISDSAAHTEQLADYTDASVLKLFNALSKYYNNIGAKGKKIAKVNSDLYNAIVDHPLNATAKHGDANIADNGVIKFKGFYIQEIPDSLFQSKESAYTYIEHSGKAFTGINTARTIESEDFDGVALQGAGRAGEYIPNDNKKAICKVSFTGV